MLPCPAVPWEAPAPSDRRHIHDSMCDIHRFFLSWRVSSSLPRCPAGNHQDFLRAATPHYSMYQNESQRFCSSRFCYMILRPFPYIRQTTPSLYPELVWFLINILKYHKSKLKSQNICTILLILFQKQENSCYKKLYGRLDWSFKRG